MVARFALMILVVLMISVPAVAREIAGIEVPEKVVQADGKELKLNGAGIRSKFFFKIYIAELYLEQTGNDVGKILAFDGGKRMTMHFLYDEVGKDDLVDAWNEGFEANGTAEQLKNCADRIEQFNALFEMVKEGDQVVLDYSPGTGTSVTIKGQEKGVIEGKDFNDLLLSIWLGKEPVTEDLKDDLLGK